MTKKRSKNFDIKVDKLTEKQANAILEMRLQRLTSLETSKLKEEYEKSRSAILVQAAEAGLNRKDSWQMKIDNLLRTDLLGGKK